MDRISEIERERQRCEEAIDVAGERIQRYRDEADALLDFSHRLEPQAHKHLEELQRGIVLAEGFDANQINTCNTAAVYSECMAGTIRYNAGNVDARYQDLRERIQRELNNLNGQIEEQNNIINSKRNQISYLNEEERAERDSQAERDRQEELARQQSQEEPQVNQ